ncbi:MAG: hypothetical protein LE168_02920 [Endomicrobium sp.]|nr:hypothetical protein [Endomicrobium sp.]
MLDTNVLPRDPDAIFSFHDNKVVISMTVVEELPLFKKFNNENGIKAPVLFQKALSCLRRFFDGWQ